MNPFRTISSLVAFFICFSTADAQNLGRGLSVPAAAVDLHRQDVSSNRQSPPDSVRLWMSPASVRADFWRMFDPGAGWDTLRSRVDVFSLHVNALTLRDTARMFAAAQMLKDAGVKVNIECGGLRPFSGCDSLAGEQHAQLELSQIARWLQRGGSVDFVTMDSPINTMIMNGDPSGTCNWTVERAAGEMVDYMKAVRAAIPGVTFALVEPVPWYSANQYPAHPGNDYGDLIRTLDTVLTVVAQRGESLEIFHSDSPYEYCDYAPTQGWLKIKAVEDFLHSRGVRHGRICNSQEGGFQSDQLFSDRTVAAWEKYIAVGGDPDEAEVWCWYEHPAANTPEWQPFTFAYTCRRLFYAIADTTPPRPRAKFEPAGGKVYHGVGQAGMGVAEYIAALADSSIHPAVNKWYYDIPGARGNKFTELRALLAAERAIGRIPELSVAFSDGSSATDSIIAISGQYDALIDSLALVCRDFGSRLFVRPGFEFNGPWNGYHPYLLPQAYRKVVDRFRAMGAADSCAFTWCYYPTGAPDDFDSVDTRGARWYPGNDVVDWFALDAFFASDFDPALPDFSRGVITSKGRSERFLAMARAHGKPVMLSETSAAGVGITSDTADGLRDWDEWFDPFFRFIGNHPEIRGFNYIDWDWTKFAQWASWGDARIENSGVILSKYREELRNPKYIHLLSRGAPAAAPPSQVVLVSPRDSSMVSSWTVQLRWHAARPDVDRYRVTVGRDARFLNIAMEDSAFTDTTALFSGAAAGSRYFWKAQAHNPEGWGPASAVWQFRREDTAIVGPTARIVIDTTVRYQTMEGWGASSNFMEEAIPRLPEASRQGMFDLVFGDLGANILCIRLYAGFQTSSGGPYNWGIMGAQRLILGEALARGNIETVWLKVSSPPGWMKDNNDDAHGGHLLPAHYQDYADYLSYYIRHMRDDYGFRIDAVSIFNEPGFGDASVNYESTSTTPEEYRDVFAIVATTFARDGLSNVILIGPEAGQIAPNMPYFSALLDDDTASAALGRITTHQYGDQLLLYGTGGSDNWNWLRAQAAAKGKNVWETEMYVGGQNMATEDIDEGLRVALLIWSAVTNGNVTAWHYWHYIWPDESAQNKAQGLISTNRDGTFSVYPRYHCFKHWSKYVPAGSVRVDAVSDNPGVQTAAFTRNGEAVVIAFNRSAMDIDATFTVPPAAGAVHHIRTSAEGNMVVQPDLAVGGHEFAVSIPSRSISTFVMPGNATGTAREPASSAPLSLAVYPVPLRDAGYVGIQSRPGARVLVALFDALGRRCALLFDGVSGSRELTLRLSVASLPAGTYFIRCNADGAAATRAVQILH